MARTSRKPEITPADQREPTYIARSQRSGWESEVFFLPPGTVSARAYGCCCAPARLGRGTGEIPYFLNVYCPLHGVDAFEEHSKGPRH
jgi:hypothetical protein